MCVFVCVCVCVCACVCVRVCVWIGLRVQNYPPAGSIESQKARKLTQRIRNTHMCPLLTAHPYLPVEGNFEVFVNDENVWSKKDGQDFPDTPEKVLVCTCHTTPNGQVQSTPLINHTHCTPASATPHYTPHANRPTG